jgi:hypothetical protein
MIGEPDETAILDMLSQADNVFRSFDVIIDTRSRYPKINNAVNLYIDWEIEHYVDEILNILIKMHIIYAKGNPFFLGKEQPKLKIYKLLLRNNMVKVDKDQLHLTLVILEPESLTVLQSHLDLSVNITIIKSEIRYWHEYIN